MAYKHFFLISVTTLIAFFEVNILAQNPSSQNYHRNSKRPQYRGYQKNNDCNKVKRKRVQAEKKKDIRAHGAKKRLLNKINRDFSQSKKVLQDLNLKRRPKDPKEWRLLRREKANLVRKLKRLDPLLKKKAVELSHYDLEYLRDRVKAFSVGVLFLIS